MENNSSIVRKNLQNLSNPLMLRELNRQMDWIWKKLLGGIQAKDLSRNAVDKIVNTTETTITEKVKTGTVETDELVASLAALMVAQIGVANIDFTKIVDMVSQQAIIKRVMASKLMVEKLIVTEANILSATLSTLVLKGADGKYYSIAIGSDGIIETEEVMPTEEDIENEVFDGKDILTDTGDINMLELNASHFTAQSAMIGDILASAMKVGKITAAEALLASAVVPQLYVTAVNAIGDSMTFSANEVIQLIIGNVDTAQTSADAAQETADAAVSTTNFERVIRILDDGLHVGDNQTSGEVLIDSGSVNVILGGTPYSKFAANYVQFGNYQLGKTTDGGLVFKLRGDAGD